MRLCTISALLSALGATGLCGQLSNQQIQATVTNSPWARPVAVEGRTVIVRWESARPVIDACAQGGMENYLFSCASKLLYLSGLQNKFTGIVEHFHVLSISNYPRMPVLGPGPHPPEHSAAANEELAEMGTRLRETTTLSAGAGATVKPVDVVVLPAGDALLVLLFFERAEPLTSQERELKFESTYGSIHISTSFSVGEMQGRGKPAL